MGYSTQSYSARAFNLLGFGSRITQVLTKDTLYTNPKCRKAISDSAATLEDKWNKEIMNVFSRRNSEGNSIYLHIISLPSADLGNGHTVHLLLAKVVFFVCLFSQLSWFPLFQY